MSNNKITGSEPAFPNSTVLSSSDFSHVDGMTLRQYYAGLAMQGILANEELRRCLLSDMKIDGTTQENYIAVWAIKNADAIIAELNKTTSQVEEDGGL